MLGDEQERWLFDNLATARARWTLVGQQVYLVRPRPWPSTTRREPKDRFDMDAWDGYAAARARLYARLKEARAPNPIVVSGDVHAALRRGAEAGLRGSAGRTVGVEITNTSLTSGGDGSDVAAGWEATRADNPHIKYHSTRRGYIACTVTPATMRAEFRTLERVSRTRCAAAKAGSVRGGTRSFAASRPG